MKNKPGTANGNRRKLKIAAVTVCCLWAVLAFVVMPVLTVSFYNGYFGRRFATAQEAARPFGHFPDLIVEECEFPTSNGRLLAGYRYSYADRQAVKGVVVLSHGFGSGHAAYGYVAYRFASNGYLVFAYDATGSDKSEGRSVEGLPQGVIDLDYALRYVKQEAQYRGLPILLFGHSWGGYCVGNVLNYHPDVKAAVMIAGFNQSGDMVKVHGERLYGQWIGLFLPYISLYERLKFGSYASCSALDGFANTDAGILVIHSSDDTVVPIQYGYQRFYAEYGEDPRFRFVKYEDRGHRVQLDQGLMAQILEFYDAYCTGTASD